MMKENKTKKIDLSNPASFGASVAKETGTKDAVRKVISIKATAEPVVKQSKQQTASITTAIKTKQKTTR